MPDNNRTMFDLSSGLPLDGARVHSVEAQFTFDQGYAPDAVVCAIFWQAHDGEGEDSGEPTRQLYSVGKSWEPEDEGARVVHKSGKFQNFNDSTNIGRLIHSFLEARGNGDVQAGLALAIDEMDTYGTPDSVDFWLNLDVSLKALKYPTQQKDPVTQLPKEGQTMVIDEYFGRFGDATPAKPKGKAVAGKAATPAKAVAAKPSGAAKGNTEVVSPVKHLGPGLLKTLKTLATEVEGHDEFMIAAFELDGVVTEDQKWNKITEKLIMDFEDGSLFAEARA